MGYSVFQQVESSILLTEAYGDNTVSALAELDVSGLRQEPSVNLMQAVRPPGSTSTTQEYP